MAKVKVEDIVDHLDREFKRALQATFKAHAPDVRVDINRAFSDFKREVYRACNSWENVPDRYVEKD